MKRVFVLLLLAALAALVSCPIESVDPEGDTSTLPDPDAPIDLGELSYGDPELSREDSLPDSGGPVSYFVHVDGGDLCAIGSLYRFETTLLPPSCLDLSLALYEASSQKLLGESDLRGCDLEEIEISWKGTCVDNDSRDLLVVVALSDPSTASSVSGLPYTLTVKALKEKPPK
jgi:hypothetical protein